MHILVYLSIQMKIALFCLYGETRFVPKSDAVCVFLLRFHMVHHSLKSLRYSGD